MSAPTSTKNSRGDTMTSSKVLRLPSVKIRTGLSRSSIYNFIAAGEFPKQIRLGTRAVGWLEAEVDEWLANRVAESRHSEVG